MIFGYLQFGNLNHDHDSLQHSRVASRFSCPKAFYFEVIPSLIDSNRSKLLYLEEDDVSSHRIITSHYTFCLRTHTINTP